MINQSLEIFFIESKHVLMIHQQWLANLFELLSDDGNIVRPSKARKSRQMQFCDKTAYVRVFAIDP